MRTEYPVITVPAHHFDYLEGVCYGSAGPRPNITGMRKMYWGQNAPIVKCCNYAFHVSAEVYYDFKLHIYD